MESNSIALERILLKVATGDTAALAALLDDATVVKLIERVSKWAAARYDQDGAEIRQALALKILTSINPLAAADKLDNWLRVVAKNYCLNATRHQNKETRAVERYSSVALLPLTPEQQLLDEENERNQEERLERLRRITRMYPPEIVDGWVAGQSPREIARVTGKPIAIVYRVLKTMRRALANEFEFEPSDSRAEQVRSDGACYQRPVRVSRPELSTDAKTTSAGDRKQGENLSDQRSQARPNRGFSFEDILAALHHLEAAELQRLVPRAIALGAARRAPHLKPTESRLLARANEGLPHDLKSRLSRLQKKRDARSLSKAESEELIALSDRVEQLHAERLEALADLARLRGKTLPELMDQLQIRFPANA